MQAVVVLDFRFDQTPDGAVWTPTAFARGFWDRYLEVFEGVKVVARARRVTAPEERQQRVDGAGVSFAAVPHYLGPLEYLRRASQVRRAVRTAISPCDAVILRVGSQLAGCVSSWLRRTGRPYGLEVVGDPREAFAAGAVRHPLRLLFRSHFVRALRLQCAGACGAAYVTDSVLQQRYPCRQHAAGISDVELPDGAYVPEGCVDFSERNARLVFVGSLEQMYKAPDVLLDAIALCGRRGSALSLTLIGDGRHRAELEARAAAVGIRDQVSFLGQLPAGDAIRGELDKASLFVLPSRTEGLPRAMLEAMARGLPCVGAAVGGIPELLPDEDLVPSGDADALSRKILEVLKDRPRMERMSARNLAKAGEYRDQKLRPRRKAFYEHIRCETERWLEGRANGCACSR